MKNRENTSWEKAEHLLLHKTWDMLSATEHKILAPYCNSQHAFDELRNTMLNVKRSFSEKHLSFQKKNEMAATLLNKFEKKRTPVQLNSTHRKKLYYIIAAAAAVVICLLAVRQTLITQNTIPVLANKKQQQAVKETDISATETKNNAEKHIQPNIAPQKHKNITKTEEIANHRTKNGLMDKKDMLSESNTTTNAAPMLMQDSNVKLYVDSKRERYKSGNGEEGEMAEESNIAYNWGKSSLIAKDSLSNNNIPAGVFSRDGKLDKTVSKGKQKYADDNKAKTTDKAKKRQIRQAFVFTDI